jgi:PAS domain S-box-containing protein
MIINQIIYIFISLLHAGLAIFVLLKNPANIINKRFCIFEFIFSLWVFFIYLTLQTTDPITAAFRLRLAFCTAIFIPSTFFFFTSIFPNQVKRQIDRYFSICFFAISIILSLFSSYIVESVSFVQQSPCAKYGPLFPVYWSYFIACMAYSLYSLYRKSISLYGIKRLQIQYLFFGVALAVFLSVITNFILPVVGIWQVERFVPILSVPIQLFVAYAIVKYHLMDISIIIKRSTAYVVLSIVLGGIYFAVGLFLGSVLPVSQYKDTITIVISTIVMVLTFVSAKESIEHVIEKTLFHTKYSHPKILSGSTMLFSSVYDLNELLRNAIQYLYNAVGIEKICMLIKDTETKNYVLKVSINFPSQDNLFISSQDAIVTWLCQNRTVLSRDQLYRFARRKSEHLLEDKMTSLDIESCIPVLQENDLFGIILLGKKINKKIFTQEDIQMFLAFSGQLAMAANNARLYMGLREAKTYRDNILQSLKNGVIVMDNNGHVTLINSEAKRILSLKDTNTTEIIFKSFGNDVPRAIEHALKSDIEYHNIEIFIDKGREKIPCGITTTKLKTEDGEKLGVLVILTDLTELKLLQAEKQHADHLARLGTLAAHIAHEIKNPLVAINTYFQLLPYKKNDEEFQSDFQKIAVKEIERINRIIEDLLDLAKPSKPVSQAIDPHAIIIDTINFLRNTAAKKNIEITTVFEKRRCQLIADEDKIKQMLLNILQNGFDALRIHGRIEISTCIIENLFEYRRMAKTNPGSAFFSFTPDSQQYIANRQYFVIKVSDNGAGISAEKIPHIFEPFFTDKEKGTGLGLAMVYRIIKDHDGGVYVESEEGAGTVFHVILPLNPINVDNAFSFLPNAVEIS